MCLCLCLCMSVFHVVLLFVLLLLPYTSSNIVGVKSGRTLRTQLILNQNERTHAKVDFLSFLSFLKQKQCQQQ